VPRPMNACILFFAPVARLQRAHGGGAART
jgi:hypothetical protein